MTHHIHGKRGTPVDNGDMGHVKAVNSAARGA